MTSKVGSGGQPDHEWVVLASFDSSRHAEHMLASLGRGFRLDARRGSTSALVVTGNADGSLNLTQSRVLTASGFGYALIRISTAWMVGFLGAVSMLKGARGGIHAARVREQHVGSEEHRAHQVLADAGPKAAIVLVRCRKQQTMQTVAAATADSAILSWNGSLTEFLAALDPGSSHDWVRAAIAKTSTTSRRSRGSPPE